MTDHTIDLSRRKILAGIGAVGAAGAGAGLGTSALFSDEETFENSVLAAGELDLIVEYASYWDQGRAGGGQLRGTQDGNGAVSAELTDVKPGDSGLLAFCPRVVDNSAFLWLCGAITENDENGYTEPEPETSADGDVNDPGDEEGAGELPEHIEVAVSYCELDDDIADDDDDDPDNDGFGPDDVEDSTEVWTGTFAEFIAAAENGLAIDGGSSTGAGDGFPDHGTQDCYAGTADDAENACLCIEWEVPTEVGNAIQSDALAFDLSFRAEQCRNNDGGEAPCEAPSDTPPDATECTDCGFDTSASTSSDVNLLSVGPDPTSGFPDVDARLRVNTTAGGAGDLTDSNFAVCENDCEQPLEDVTFESGGLVDIVVVFDDTGSMGGEIDTLQSEVTGLTSDVEDEGVDARYALVSFKDEVEIDQDFTDASTFQAAVNDLDESGGGDRLEDNLDAIAVGTGDASPDEGSPLSSFRSGAQRVLIDITDQAAHPASAAETDHSQSEVEDFLDAGNFSFYAVCPPESDTGPVSKETVAGNVEDGTWIDINSADFGVILNDVVESITEEAYVLSYASGEPSTDGTTRTVDIQVTDPTAGTLYQEGTYTSPSS